MENPLVPRLRGFGETIFAPMTALAVEHDAINLGQGFPDIDGPREVLDAAAEAMAAGHNQYAPGVGIPALREAVAQHQREFYDIELDPKAEVIISAGATEGMTAAILAFCDVGDEVIALEPSYDCYSGAVAMAGGVFKQVRLHEPSYSLDLDELRAAITSRTRILVVNSPHNPTGHVLSADELAGIAALAQEFDLLVLADEVYEHLTFDRPHIPIATLPGMAERTVTISSAGKTFAVTGWKIGWLSGPARLLKDVLITKQNMTFTNGTPLQFGVAAGLRLPRDWFEGQRVRYQQARDQLISGLEAAGMQVHPSEGTFFVIADISGHGYRDGIDFCERIPGEIGVGAIPSQVFYTDPESAKNYVRFCYAKRADVLTEAARRLATLGERR
ncbi:aminotransferase class I/II-fold pyridoxal phosphate-dependent enzyme [Enemella evansiae]|uniref:aminotransferase class I/II-fold pyridoxal phosphate-dependent enzyme n=1 Tax=Enemella evansiae TaxID=2016499 RepID=UPI000B969B95|nr:aminotransferase class I/II-fold pyridoxal phosphate-dependent enzyme [Enemella evansiae]OYO20614.1 aminotransferase [Enemella evansiae]TDO93181.1 succinyldiaminopimelate aminotransferase [Enemella evansiae]